jgi:ribonuclease HI
LVWCDIRFETGGFGLDHLSVYTDGASRGNPGPAAIGYVMYDSAGNLFEEGAKCIGRHTNNEAEYEALLWAIERTRERTCSHVSFFTDSELVAKQHDGGYTARDDRMKRYAMRVKANEKLFKSFSLKNVPRDNPRIRLVDQLVNKALDRECAR